MKKHYICVHKSFINNLLNYKIMKKSLFLILVLNFCLFTFSQNISSGKKYYTSEYKKYNTPEYLKNFSLNQSVYNIIDNPMNLQGEPNSYTSTKENKDISDAQIGNTIYDWQTNASVPNRIYLYDDGTIGTVWTYGTAYATGFPERGTGYNYFNGTNWGTIPSSRVESARCGWPSYSPLGNNGEIIVCHNSSTGLYVSKRTQKGTGVWTQTFFPGPVGSEDIMWSRMITSGADRNTVHIIAITNSVGGGGALYQGLDGAIVYSRSTDGGQTWGINNIILPGMESTDYIGFNGDIYSWAESKGDTIAFVVGDEWIDVFVMKSTDGGDTWTKQLVYQHPYPMWTESVLTSNVYACDGSVSIALDNSPEHHAHVVFGRMKVLNDSVGDDITSYFPYTDGIIYWNDTMPAYTTDDLNNTDPITDSVLAAEGKLIAWNLDMNGNDTIEWNELPNSALSFGKYSLSTTSMANIVINDNNNIFVVYSGVIEASQEEYYYEDFRQYRHLFARAYNADSAKWGNFIHLTNSPDYYYSENVFPSVAANSDSYLHLLFQADMIPGAAVYKDYGDIHPYIDNSIMYLKVTKTDFENIPVNTKKLSAINECKIFPNPSSNTVYISFNLSETSVVGIKVSDLMGQTIYEKNKGTLPDGNHVIPVDVKDFSSGIYFVTIQNEAQYFTDKIIVQ